MLLTENNLLAPFANKQERDAAVQALPAASEQERAILRRTARQLIQQEPADIPEMERRVAEALDAVSLQFQPSHLDWLLYYLRVESHLSELAAQAQDDADAMTALLIAT